MKKILMAMSALGAIAATTPAAAQQYPNQGPSAVQGNAALEIGAQLGNLDARIEAGLRARTISRSEARALRNELGEISRMERYYARDGLSRTERQELRTRVQALRQRIAQVDGRFDRDWSDRDDRRGRDCPPGLDKRDNGCVPPGQVGRDRDWDDRDDRGGFIDRNRDGYDDRDTNRDGRIDSRDGGWNDGDRDWDDRDGGFIDRNRDGYDDRDTNRDGRIDSRDGGYDDRRSGIGGVLDRVLGGGGLRVGQRVSGNLGPVPYEHRDHYRDGNGVYYRSDGRAIYQIDARSDVVLQVYPLRR